MPLCDRLDEYVEDAGLTSKKPSLVHFPPEFQPVPAKPLFFDLALSQVEFPPLDEKKTEPAMNASPRLPPRPVSQQETPTLT